MMFCETNLEEISQYYLPEFPTKSQMMREPKECLF